MYSVVDIGPQCVHLTSAFMGFISQQASLLKRAFCSKRSPIWAFGFFPLAFQKDNSLLIGHVVNLFFRF